MIRPRDRRRAWPVLADEPLVGEHLTRRLRIVLVALAIAFVLTNVTSYLIGQTFSATARADANRDAGRRVAELERKFNEDLAERKAERDRLDAAQAARVEQLRRDICVVLDRVQPRDDAVQAARRRYGCTANPKPAESTSPGAGSPSGAGSTGGGTTPAGGGTQSGGGSQGPAGPPGPPGPGGSPAPSPSPTTPPPQEPAGGSVCLPLLGCVL